MSSPYALNNNQIIVYDVVSFRKMISSLPQSLALAVTQNDLATTSGSVSLTGTIAATITGMVAPLDDELKILANDSTANVTLTHNDSASVAANRIHTETGAPFVLRPKTSILMQYRVATAGWRIVGGLGDDVRTAKLSVTSPNLLTIVGPQNDVLIGSASSVRLNPPSPLTITGIAAGFAGQLLFLENISAQTILLTDSDTASTTANRIKTGVAGQIELSPDAALLLKYDGVSNLWRVIGGTGGSSKDKIQTINSATSTTVTGWGYYADVTFTAAGQTLTAPTIGASDVGKTIKIRNAGAFDFTLAIASGSISSNVGLVIKAGQALTLEAASTTLAAVLATNAKDYTRTVQQLNATGTIAAWDSTVEIGATPLTANTTLTLPACTGQAGKELTLKRLDNTTFTVTIVANGADTTEVTTPDLLNLQFGAIGLRCVSGTKSEQIYSIGASAPSVQQLNATGTISRWHSIVEIGATPLTANAVLTLPNCANNSGKDIVFKRLDNTAFTVTIVPGSGNTTEITTPSILNTQLGAITLTCVSNTTSEQTNSIGGSAVDAIQVVSSATSTAVTTWNSFVEATFTGVGQTLTIPTIAIADIGKEVGVRNAGTNAFTLALQTGVLTSAIGFSITPGMSVWVEAISTTSAVVTATNAAPVQILTAKTDFIKNDVAGSGTPFTTITAVSGYVGERINWDAPLSNGLGVTISNGVFQFPTTDRVSLRASIHPTHTTGIAAMFSLVEITAGVATILQSQKAGQAVSSASNPLPSGNIDWTFDPDPAKSYAIEFTGGWTSNIYNSGSRLNWLQIEKVGVVGTVSTLPSVAAMQGQKIWADRTTDLGDWILLDGRLKSALTVAQQAIATALGYGTNIPDMRGRMAMGALAGTYPLLSAGGSFTIARANLPNDTLVSTPNSSFTPSGSVSTNVNAIFHSATGGGFNGGRIQLTDRTGFTQNNPSELTVSASFTGSAATLPNYTTSSINGGVAQTSFVPAYGTGNWFVWLGATAPTVTFASASLQQLNATGNVLAWNSIVEVGSTALTANLIATLPSCSAADIGKTIKFTRRDAAAFTAILAASGGNTLDVSSSTALNTQYGAIEIACVSATKSEQISLPTDIATIGDAKSGFQSADHRGWVLLNGRLKTALTATQQAAATLLGFGANIPDAAGRAFIQGALGAQIGSNTISQTNLPNVSIPTNAVANHTHSYTAANGSTQGVALASRGAGEISAVQNSANTSGAGGHSHTIDLNGNVTQTSYIPAAIGVNQFVYLGV
jgi:hypothetical protein